MHCYSVFLEIFLHGGVVMCGKTPWSLPVVKLSLYLPIYIFIYHIKSTHLLSGYRSCIIYLLSFVYHILCIAKPQFTFNHLLSISIYYLYFSIIFCHHPIIHALSISGIYVYICLSSTYLLIHLSSNLSICSTTYLTCQLHL